VYLYQTITLSFESNFDFDLIIKIGTHERSSVCGDATGADLPVRVHHDHGQQAQQQEEKVEGVERKVLRPGRTFPEQLMYHYSCLFMYY
jgi:hypothetical protein